MIGFEMFPRRVQPALDRWVKGELTEQEFLNAVNWRKSWGYDAKLYMPLFDFARMNRIPVVAERGHFVQVSTLSMLRLLFRDKRVLRAKLILAMALVSTLLMATQI